MGALMTLKEFSDTLNDIMTRHGPDAMVRMVVKAGANTATMDWPGPDYMP